MKPRPPGTIAEGVTKIMGALTPSGAAAAVGKSEWLVRQWSDPDQDAKPSLPQAIALDRAYLAAGFQDPPLLAIYRLQLHRRPDADGLFAAGAIESLRSGVLGLQCDLGTIAGNLQAAATDGLLTLQERAQLAKPLDDLILAAQMMRAQLACEETKS